MEQSARALTPHRPPHLNVRLVDVADKAALRCLHQQLARAHPDRVGLAPWPQSQDECSGLGKGFDDTTGFEDYGFGESSDQGMGTL
jgi:hypothetical protein